MGAAVIKFETAQLGHPQHNKAIGGNVFRCFPNDDIAVLEDPYLGNQKNVFHGGQHGHFGRPLCEKSEKLCFLMANI